MKSFSMTKLSKEQFLDAVDQVRWLPPVNIIEVNAMVKGDILYKEIEIENEKIPCLKAIVETQSLTREHKKTQTRHLSKIPFATYGPTAEDTNRLAFNGWYHIVGSIRMLQDYARKASFHKIQELAAYLQMPQDDPIIENVLSSLHIKPNGDPWIEDIEKLEQGQTDPVQKSNGEYQTVDSHIILAAHIRQGVPDTHHNKVILQGIVYMPPDVVINTKNGSAKVSFKLMVYRADKKTFDIIRCVWNTEDTDAITKKLQQGKPVRIEGSLEQDVYRMKYLASDAEVSSLARLLNQSPNSEDVQNIIKLFELNLDQSAARPGKKPRIIHEVEVHEIFFDEFLQAE